MSKLQQLKNLLPRFMVYSQLDSLNCSYWGPFACRRIYYIYYVLFMNTGSWFRAQFKRKFKYISMNILFKAIKNLLLYIFSIVFRAEIKEMYFYWAKHVFQNNNTRKFILSSFLYEILIIQITKNWIKQALDIFAIKTFYLFTI